MVMIVKLTTAQNVTRDFQLPEELDDLCCACWNAGHDGVSLESAVDITPPPPPEIVEGEDRG